MFQCDGSLIKGFFKFVAGTVIAKGANLCHSVTHSPTLFLALGLWELGDLLRAYPIVTEVANERLLRGLKITQRNLATKRTLQLSTVIDILASQSQLCHPFEDLQFIPLTFPEVNTIMGSIVRLFCPLAPSPALNSTFICLRC